MRRRAGPHVERERPHDGDEYLYVERFDCCNDSGSEHRFNEWYDRQHVASVLDEPGFERATRYELYRVLMVEPKTATR